LICMNCLERFAYNTPGYKKISIPEKKYVCRKCVEDPSRPRQTLLTYFNLGCLSDISNEQLHSNDVIFLQKGYNYALTVSPSLL